MASAIDIATAEADRAGRAGAPSPDAGGDPAGRGQRRRAPRRRRRPVGGRALAAGAGRRVAADPAHRRGQRAAAGAAGGRLSLSRQVRGEPDRPADRVAAHPGRDLRRRARRGRRARLGRRGRDAAARSGAPDDAPPGRADPHPRAAVRHRGQADRRQPAACAGRATRCRSPSCRRPTSKGLLPRARRPDLRLDRRPAAAPAQAIRSIARADTAADYPRGRCARCTARAARRCAATRRPAAW